MFPPSDDLRIPWLPIAKPVLFTNKMSDTTSDDELSEIFSHPLASVSIGEGGGGGGRVSTGGGCVEVVLFVHEKYRIEIAGRSVKNIFFMVM